MDKGALYELFISRSYQKGGGEVLEEFLDQSDDDVTHIEHLIKSNIEVCNTPLLKPAQFPMLILHPFDKSRI